MRKFLPLFVLFQAVVAFAQITISEEVVSDPMPPTMAPLNLAVPAVSLAKDRAGAAIAWSMAAAGGVDRIYVARLDANGRIAGTPREIPPSVTSSATHEAYPALAPAPGGDGFVLAWVDIDHDLPVTRTVVARLDAALTPSAPQRVNSGTLPTAPPIVRTKDDTTWITVSGTVWSLSKDGILSLPLTGIAASDMTVAVTFPQAIGGRTLRNTSFSCIPNCRDDYSLDFVSLWTTTQINRLSFKSDIQPAIDSSGGDVLVVLFRGDESSGGDVIAWHFPASEVARIGEFMARAAVVAHFPADAGVTRPSIAHDGLRSIVVWRARIAPGNHDVAGAVLDNDGSVTPLSIASSAADERDPAVLSFGGGVFLVAYEKVTNGERRIAGRFVRFGRVRAAR